VWLSPAEAVPAAPGVGGFSLRNGEMREAALGVPGSCDPIPSCTVLGAFSQAFLVQAEVTELLLRLSSFPIIC